MPEIKELAKVQRPVVSTWRRRYPDFPQPVTGDHAHPLFDAVAVADWLVTTGRASRREIDGELRLHALKQLGGQLPPRALIASLTSLIALRHHTDDELDDGRPGQLRRLRHLAADCDPTDELLRSEIDTLRVDWLPGIVDELIEAAYSPAGAFERIMEVRGRLGATELAADRLDPLLVDLIAKLAGAASYADLHGTVTICDPYAGCGDLLLAISALRDDQPMELTACCSDPYLARLTARRLAVRDLHEGSFTVRTTRGTILQAAHVIITQLPYLPGEERSVAETLDLMSELSADLRTGATAVVVAPADTIGALNPHSQAGRLRADLLKNATKAIIRLPGGLVPFRPGYEAAVWVLNAYYGTDLPGLILSADVSDQPLTEAIVDALATDIRTWREPGFDPDAHRRNYAVQLPIAALVTSPRTLSPRYLTMSDQPAFERVARSLELEGALQKARPGKALSAHLETRLTTPRPRTETLAQLTKGARDRANLLSLHNGTRLFRELVRHDPGRARSYPVIGSPEVCGDSPRGSRVVDRLEFEKRHPKARRTLPGDVVITTAPEPAALVDHDGYSVVEFPARVLRITQLGREHFTPRVLAVLLTRPGRAPKAIRPVQRLDELWLPLLPSDDLWRLDQMLADLDERRRLAVAELEALDELSRLAATGLTDGTLTLTDHGKT
ncbi:hypothetical protein [Actinomadura chokoriensis]|uniref:DNA methylase adenine-specific domain-containing protein n=1 Tax=Actinomadura chokoriensis TaxID=454156 RepID=A0ABV4RBA0_9ACTN